MVYSKIEVSTKEEFLNAFLKDEYFPGNIKLNKNLSELTVFQYIEKLFIENCDNIKLKYLYARCLNLGFGCEIDFKLSNKLFVECGEFPMAEYALAISYRKGEGVTKNINRAIELYEKAASAGFGYAQKNLGLLFYYGEEIETDLNKAKYWLNLAYKNGFFELKEILKDCKSEKNTINTTEEEKENLENIIYERNAKWINIGEFLTIIWLLLGVIGSIVVGTIFGINMKNVYNEINNILISMTLSIVLLFVCTSTFVFNIIIIHIAETVHKKLD